MGGGVSVGLGVWPKGKVGFSVVVVGGGEGVTIPRSGNEGLQPNTSNLYAYNRNN